MLKNLSSVSLFHVMRFSSSGCYSLSLMFCSFTTQSQGTNFFLFLLLVTYCSSAICRPLFFTVSENFSVISSLNIIRPSFLLFSLPEYLLSLRISNFSLKISTFITCFSYICFSLLYYCF